MGPAARSRPAGLVGKRPLTFPEPAFWGSTTLVLTLPDCSVDEDVAWATGRGAALLRGRSAAAGAFERLPRVTTGSPRRGPIGGAGPRPSTNKVARSRRGFIPLRTIRWARHQAPRPGRRAVDRVGFRPRTVGVCRDRPGPERTMPRGVDHETRAGTGRPHETDAVGDGRGSLPETSYYRFSPSGRVEGQAKRLRPLSDCSSPQDRGKVKFSGARPMAACISGNFRRDQDQQAPSPANVGVKKRCAELPAHAGSEGPPGSRKETNKHLGPRI